MLYRIHHSMKENHNTAYISDLLFTSKDGVPRVKSYRFSKEKINHMRFAKRLISLVLDR